MKKIITTKKVIMTALFVGITLLCAVLFRIHYINSENQKLYNLYLSKAPNLETINLGDATEKKRNADGYGWMYYFDDQMMVWIMNESHAAVYVEGADYSYVNGVLTHIAFERTEFWGGTMYYSYLIDGSFLES